MIRIAIITFIIFCASSIANAQIVPVNVESIQLNDLFAVEYNTYSKEPIGKITIQNPSDRNLQINITISGQKYLKTPTKISKMIPAKQSIVIPLNINLDESVLNIKKKTENVPISIEVNTLLNNIKVKSNVLNKNLVINNRHILPNDDYAKIAMFVNPYDMNVVLTASKKIKDQLKASKTDVNSAEVNAKTVFDFLLSKTIQCSGSGDNQIQYPSELLKTRIGSYCDCSLLYVSILEYLGVETKLVFNRNMTLPLYKSQKEWSPVDMSMLSKDFDKARLSGKQLLNTMLIQKANELVLREAWKKYSPPNASKFILTDMSSFNSAMDNIMENNLSEASQIFEQLRQKYPDNSIILNNSANLALLLGNIDRAIERYNLALKKTPEDAGIYINLGLAYNMKGDEEQCFEYLNKAYDKAGDYQSLCQMLDLDVKNDYYNEISMLLKDAEKRQSRENISSLSLGTRNIKKSLYPLYWKNL